MIIFPSHSRGSVTWKNPLLSQWGSGCGRISPGLAVSCLFWQIPYAADLIGTYYSTSGFCSLEGAQSSRRAMRKRKWVSLCMQLPDQTRQGSSEGLCSFLWGGKKRKKVIFVISWENDPERRLTLDAKEELEESDSSSLYKLLYLCLWIDILYFTGCSTCCHGIRLFEKTHTLLTFSLELNIKDMCCGLRPQE